ncbi:MAG: N-acetyltransferase [Alphaproteobacteria bacterium]|nr:N-acetyltransferase [Alphaproteobacteria bacterium]
MTTPDIRLEDLGRNRGRYVTTIDGHVAELTFVRRPGGVLVADHTGVPDALGGQGVGKALVQRLVADARALGLKITPACSFVEALFRRNPDWADLRA